jgi:DnaJ-class molecular chaperone
MKIPQGTQHDEKKKMSSYGIQKLPPNNSSKGNHFVQIKVKIPKKISTEQRAAMEAYAKLEEDLSQ